MPRANTTAASERDSPRTGRQRSRPFEKRSRCTPPSKEAWNELGYAFRNQGRYAESLSAYDEALRLRPDFPEALEYLGEAYVKMGRLDDARRVRRRLRQLDTAKADELAEEIEKTR